MTSLRLVKRKELWVPTLWGWMLLLLAMTLTITFYVRNIRPVLSVSPNRSVPRFLPWKNGYLFTCSGAASEFKDHDYIILVVLGDGRRWVVSILRKAGVDESQIVKIPVEPVRKDRTFATAVALRNWLLSSGMSGKVVNVYTVGAHARRSRLLFREALAPDFMIGVISCEDRDYDPDRWWESSEGFKTVIDETLAYVYTRLFFLPARALK